MDRINKVQPYKVFSVADSVTLSLKYLEIFFPSPAVSFQGIFRNRYISLLSILYIGKKQWDNESNCQHRTGVSPISEWQSYKTKSYLLREKTETKHTPLPQTTTKNPKANNTKKPLQSKDIIVK